MPPHTISPSPSSAGLGISYSTLSPLPPHQQHGPPVQTLTGMGVGPGPRPPSSMGQGPPSPTRNPRQPTFALRPTHSRTSSTPKGFTSFSAIPPSDAGPSQPRRLPHPPRQASSSSQAPPQAAPAPQQRAPSRAGSTASTATSGSRGPRKAKSVDLLRRFSRNETVSGGRYVPLSGEDEHERQGSLSGSGMTQSPIQDAMPRMDMDARYTPEEPAYVPDGSVSSRRPLPSQPGQSCSLPRNSSSSTISKHDRTPSRASTASSAATVTRAESHSDSPGQQSSVSTHISVPPHFPVPPNHAPRTMTSSSDFTGQSFHRRSYTARSMGRSLSQPLNLHSVAESEREMSMLGHSQDGHAKRLSNISTGVHSKNAVLFGAESGGMMLAFSPSGDGVWREGEMICGSHTGLIPTPQTVPRAHMPGPEPDDPTYADPDHGLKSRPWSDSTMSQHQPPFLRTHGRSHSDGAMLARQGTLFFPSGSSKRTADELGIMLGGRRRRVSQSQLMSPPDLSGWEQAGGHTEKVKLEAAKKRKARVEVDVVLERECVVEGGEVRGRMEVRVTGGKKCEGLRVGAGKVRVLGFEEIGTSSRHVFYHHPHELPLFAHPPLQNGPRSSLFASGPDDEGYHLAAEGSHAIPFNLRLPMNGGAKGAYTSPSAKGPCVRYVVVGSVKIHVPSTGKRSIAHFYRSIVVLPYLNPAIVLAPNPEPIEACVEKGLGWNLGGEKGRVEIRVALGRRNWVSGQRIWCEVVINNESTKKIKSLNLALLQTVQTFNPQPLLEAGERRSFLRRSATEPTGIQDLGTPEMDACQTSTSRRKVNEEVMEADFADKGAGRVTGKGWWTGVEPGESGHWDLSLLVPSGMLSLRRTRLVEVTYNLRVTVNSSIYVDIPVNLINFLSIDPPPMPADTPRLLSAPVQAQVPVPLIEGDLEVIIGKPRGPTRMQSQETMTTMNPAKASSTTLHLDALLQAGRARAEAEGQGTKPARARPESMNSDYTLQQQTPVQRPRHQRMQSYLSGRSEVDEIDEESSCGDHDDQAMMAARRAQGRQMSLAALGRAAERKAKEDDEEYDRAEQHLEGGKDEIMSPMTQEFRPDQTPAEVSMAIVADGSAPSTDGGHSSANTLRTRDSRPRRGSHLSIVTMPMDATPQLPKEHDARPHEEEEGEEAEEEAGNETILEDLVSHHSHHDAEGDGQEVPPLSGAYGGYDYAEEDEDEDDKPLSRIRPSEYKRRQSLPRQLPQLNIDPRLSIGLDPERERHILNSRSINGSFAASAVSEGESEVGQVYEAVKRNVSIKVPSRLLPLDRSNPEPTEDTTDVVTPKKNRPSNDFAPAPRSSQAYLSVNSIGGSRGDHSSGTRERRDSSVGSRGSASRRGSAPHVYVGTGTRRESSNPPVPSPLRQVEDTSPSSARVIQKKSSFSFATPGSPLRVRVGHTPSHVRIPVSPGISPRTLNPGTFHHSPSAEPMAREPSATSQLRHELAPVVVVKGSPTPSQESDIGNPGLAPSVASDSASSDDHALESPPVPSFPIAITGRSGTKGPDLSAFEYAGLKTGAVLMANNPSDDWSSPPEHLINPTANFLHTDPHETSPHLHSSGQSAASDDHSTMSHETSHSILPGVRSKIAQMESRQEALRKFSVASISASAPRTPTIAPPNVGPSSRSPSGRKSYTTALGSRPARTSSSEIPPKSQRESMLGGTTYIKPKVHSMSPPTSAFAADMFAGYLDPFGVGVKREMSVSSNGSLSGRVARTSVGGVSPREASSPRVRMPISWGGASRVSEETDESEGLL